MLTVDRQRLVLEIILKNKSGSVAQLAQQFSVSQETIRRDLKVLEQEGFLRRTYGGAYVQEGVQNVVTSNMREGIFVESKRKIATICASFIEEGDVLFLDSSTTALFICDAIIHQRLTVVTNSFKILQRLIDQPSIQLHLIGGSLDYNSKSFVGPTAAKNFAQYYVDKAFISCDSISIRHGVTDNNEAEADIRQLAVTQSKRAILIADHTKFNKTSFVKICRISDLDSIVVDTPVDDSWHKEMERVGTKLYEYQ